MEHIWTMLMHKILQNHLLCTFVVNLKIGAIYALFPESSCDKNLAIRKVLAFCDSEVLLLWTAWGNSQNYQVCPSDDPLFIFRRVMMMKTILMVIVFFLFHCGFNGNACRLSISKCHLVEKRRFDRFGLYQVDKMVINPLWAAEPPSSNSIQFNKLLQLLILQIDPNITIRL